MTFEANFTDYSVEGARHADLEAAIKRVEARQGDLTAVRVTTPEIDTGFAPLFRSDKEGIYVTLHFRSPGNPRDLLVFYVERSVVTNQSTLDSRTKKTRIEEITEDQQTAASGFDGELREPVKHNRTYDIVQLIAVDENDTRIKNPDFDPRYTGIGTPPFDSLFGFTTPDKYNVPSSPSLALILTNSLDPQTKKYDAYVIVRTHAPLTSTGAAQTMRAAQVERVINKFTRTSDGKVLKEGRDLTEAELDQVDAASVPANRGYVDHLIKKFKAAEAYTWDQNSLAGHGERKTSTGAPVSFNAGGMATAAAGIPEITSVSLTRDENDPYDGKNSRLILNYTQPATPVLLRSAQIEVSRDGGSSWKTHDEEVLLNRKEAWNTAGAKSITLDVVKTKKLVSHVWRVTITAEGGATRQVTLTQTTGDDDNVPKDTDRPSTPAAPIVSAFVDGNIKVEADIPASQNEQIEKYRFHMSTSNTAPNRDTPTVGVADVVALKKGHLFVMFNRSLSDISSVTFWLGVQAKNKIGWSEWSARTSILGSTISRPLEDSIGSGVPRLPMGLERNGTSGTGHGLSTFVLDAGASSVDDFYNGMILHRTGGAANDRIRVITDYVGSTRTCTVANWNSTPVGAVSYEIHYLMDSATDNTSKERAGNTGTGHDTTHVVLDASASAVDDHYNGGTIYIPSQTGIDVDQIRRITDYVGSTKRCTIEPAYGAAPSGEVGYMLTKGSFGAANSDQTGIVTPVGMRIFLDTDTGQDVVEAILPTGENALSLVFAQMQMAKKSTGNVRKDERVAIDSLVGFRFNAPASGAFTPVVRLRFQNRFRAGGSDGYSTYTYWVQGFRANATGAGAEYDPGTFVPPVSDQYDDSNWPNKFGYS